MGNCNGKRGLVISPIPTGLSENTLKAVSHDATSLMRFGFVKLVSPCDRAKNVQQDTFKSPVRLF